MEQEREAVGRMQQDLMNSLTDQSLRKDPKEIWQKNEKLENVLERIQEFYSGKRQNEIPDNRMSLQEIVENVRGRTIEETAVLQLKALYRSLFGKDKAQEAENSFFAMNTYMTFTAYGEGAEDALVDARVRVEEVEALWSVTDEGSEIYRANHSGGEPVNVSEETAELVYFALEMAEKTDGALEPTIDPVLRAWGFTTDTKQVPSQEEIDALLEDVGHEKITLDGTLLTVPEGMELDLGAVGKGYAGDLAAEAVRARGIECAILSLGGNIQAVGSRPDGTDWRVGLRSPWEDGTLGVLRVSDQAVVTSGGYENYFEDEDGNVYWHILDPETGYPAKSGLLSVTIICPQGRMGDALSTALFVMGPQKAEEYWRENGDFEMILVTEEGEILITEGVADHFTLSEGRTEEIRVISR